MKSNGRRADRALREKSWVFTSSSEYFPNRSARRCQAKLTVINNRRERAIKRVLDMWPPQGEPVNRPTEPPTLAWLPNSFYRKIISHLPQPIPESTIQLRALRASYGFKR